MERLQPFLHRVCLKGGREMRCFAQDRIKRLTGVLLMLGGIMLVFICLPVELLLICLGIALSVLGLLLLR